ncbi:hypothetical protein BDF19DRAFT_431035 [Syncephalis fuscata]|nr:hypothetical protein BDF19DRAFT_431035 [Syncephalis fuscata]
MLISKKFALAILLSVAGLCTTDAWRHDAHIAIGRLMRQLLPVDTGLYLDKLFATSSVVEYYGVAALYLIQ